MELDDILLLQELQSISEISLDSVPAPPQYFIPPNHHDDYDLFLHLSGLHDVAAAPPAAHHPSSPLQLTEISSPFATSTITHPYHSQYPPNQLHDAAAHYDHQAAAHTATAMTFDADAVQPDDSAAAEGRGVKHDQQTAARRLIYLQGSNKDHNHGDRAYYTAGLGLTEANKGSAGGVRKNAEKDEWNEEHARGSSEEELATATFSSSSSKEEEEEKKPSGTLSGSSRKPHNKMDRMLKTQTLHRGIAKRAAPFVPPPQYRRPIIIHTYSPKIIHTRRSEFMWLVQSLTGSADTQSRCLNNPPRDRHHDRLLHGSISAASMEAQDYHPAPAAHAPSYHDDKLQLAPRQAHNLMATPSYHHGNKFHFAPVPPTSPINSPAITPNTASIPYYQTNHSFNYTTNVISSSCRSLPDDYANRSLTLISSPLLQVSTNLVSQAHSNRSPSLTDYINDST